MITRFAPSPTGRLHLGHAASALYAYDMAQEQGGTFLLRIEDIDAGRCREEFVAGIFEDLVWLGLCWPTPVRRQSQHLDFYQKALEKLHEDKLLYPCFCTRKEIALEVEQAGAAPHLSPEEGDESGPLYPGSCRTLSRAQRSELLKTRTPAWRLDMEKAIQKTGSLVWFDGVKKQEVLAKPERFGDVVLARRDVPTSYHLSVTMDDALQGVTHVTRGQDLYAATDIHRLLQALLDLPTPVYCHHPLVLGPDGKRLAKRDKAVTLLQRRQQGATPQQIRAEVKFS